VRRAALLLVAAWLATPALAASPATETEHVVGEGETLNGIANRAGVSSKAIIDANALQPPYALRAGRTLKIPRTASAKASTKTSAGTTAASKAAAAKPVGSKSAVTKTAAEKPSAKVAPVKPAATSTKAVGKSAGPSVQESTHVVAEGETLGGIAARAQVPRVLIAEANGLKPPYSVRPGQTLQIPRTRHHTVKSGDTGFAIAYQYAVPWTQIAIANGLDPKTAVAPGQELLIPTVLTPPPVTPASANNAAALAAAAARAPAGRTAARFAWPLEGTVKRGWRARNTPDHHDGLDIGAPRGTPVRAAAAGTVIFAGNEDAQFGNLVVIDHGDGWNTAYGFLNRITVKKGARIAAGERLGLVGDSGKARGTELHFEVRQDGVPIDPEPELPPAP